MKAGLIALFTILSLSRVLPCDGVLITFDDLTETASGSFIANGYQGLVWSNYASLNAVQFPMMFPGYGTNGFYYGMVSASNVAFNALGTPVEVDSISSSFNFFSAFLTGAWHSNLNVEVQGFRSGSMVYDQTVTVSATNASLFVFNYLNVDRVYFNSFGGQTAFASDGGNHFVMDDFTFEFVPEPSTLLLTGIGAAVLLSFRRRR